MDCSSASVKMPAMNSSSPDLNALTQYIDGVGSAARKAAALMAAAPTAAKNKALLALARCLRDSGPAL